MIRVMTVSLISLFVLVPLIFVSIGYFISAPSYKGTLSDHFNGQTFTNPTGVKSKGLIDVIKWALNRTPGEWTKVYETDNPVLPVKNFSEGIRITFVNHSTFLIQVDGFNILTDPVWSDRVSPFTWIGPSRMRPAGISLEDLPRIDAVILSHNHYDHLDLHTLGKLYSRHKPVIITPLGVKQFLDNEEISGAEDLDWWAIVNLGGIIIQSVPAQHFSGRGMFDRDATLWCGYVLRTDYGSIYFAGDTGYNGQMFKDIASKCGRIKIALIPIGAYKPEWFMSPIHVNPEEAVQIHIDLGAEISIASHYGTFPLADDGQFEPLEDLSKARSNKGISESQFITLKEGAFIELN
jgi:L-ascorbate metabolism protein UlaG (beta-lactamase superfamily)